MPDKFKKNMAATPRKPYASMYGKGPILVNESKGKPNKDDTVMQKDELMYKSVGNIEASQNEGAKQRYDQALTMAKAGNKDAQEWLRKNGMEGMEDVSGEDATSRWYESMKSAPKHK